MIFDEYDPYFHDRDPDEPPDPEEEDDREYAYAMSAWDSLRKVWVPVPERRDA